MSHVANACVGLLYIMRSIKHTAANCDIWKTTDVRLTWMNGVRQVVPTVRCHVKRRVNHRRLNVVLVAVTMAPPTGRVVQSVIPVVGASRTFKDVADDNMLR